MENEEKHKYITYRESRNAYQVKIKSQGQIITRSAKTLSEALKIRTELLQLYKLSDDLLLSIYDKTISKEAPTFAEAFADFEHSKESEITSSTLYKYLECERLINPLLGDRKIDTISHDAWQLTFTCRFVKHMLHIKSEKIGAFHWGISSLRGA